MKKLSVLALAIFCLTISVSAIPLQGFLGISFGASKDEAKVIMSERGYKTPEASGNTLAWENSPFAGRNGLIILGFFKDQFFTGLVRIKADSGKALELYYSITSDMAFRYGKADIEREEYKSPYTKGDGHEETALFSNAATIYRKWNFDNGDYIIVNLEYDKKEGSAIVEVSYTNKASMDKYSAAQRSSNINDL